MDQLFLRAASRGLLIMPDMHRLGIYAQNPPELWYGSGTSYTYADYQRGWNNTVSNLLSVGNLWYRWQGRLWF